MNLFELILKQARQRALSTILTLFSIALGVGLAIAIMVLYRESQTVFGQTDYGYEVLAGVKGSGLQLAVNTIYHIDRSPGNIKYSVYEDLTKLPVYRQDVRLAIPQCVGDSYQGMPIVGTTAEFFGYDNSGKRIDEDRRFEYRPGKSFEIAEGKPLDDRKFQAVVGSEVLRKTGLKIGDVFQATHGFPQPGQTPDIHKEKWKVVGVLAPTHTAADRCVWIGLTSFYTIGGHATAELQRAMIRQGKDPSTHPMDDDDDATHCMLSDDGTILLDADVAKAREVSAILIKTRSGFAAMNLMYKLNLEPDVMAINPATTMREFFANFLDGPIKLLLVISALVTVVAAVGILTTIYNSVSARTREIAILRALGATRRRILVLISTEAAFVGLVGAVIGFVLGHALCAVGSQYLEKTLGEGVNWTRVSPNELWYLLGVVAIAFVAGLVPALKAYRTPVATNLVST